MSARLRRRTVNGLNRAILVDWVASRSRSPEAVRQAMSRLTGIPRSRRYRIIAIRPVPGGHITAAEIIAEFAVGHGVSVNDLLSRSRGRRLARVRHAAMYEVARRTRLSLPQIGRAFGDRDHTTVLAGLRRHIALNNLPPVRGLSSQET